VELKRFCKILFWVHPLNHQKQKITRVSTLLAQLPNCPIHPHYPAMSLPQATYLHHQFSKVFLCFLLWLLPLLQGERVVEGIVIVET
jgi:hypothetical protein